MRHASVRAAVMLASLVTVAVFAAPGAAVGTVAGGIVWADQFGTSADDSGWAIAADASGVYAGGQVAGTLPGETSAGGVDAFLVKDSHDGRRAWTSQVGGTFADVVRGVAVNGTWVYAAGYTYSDLPGETWLGGLDAFLLQLYAESGTIHSVVQFGTASDDMAYAVAADSTGAYVVGQTLGVLPGQVSQGGPDAFLMKIDTAGTIQWTRQFGTAAYDAAYGVAIDASGIYVAGQTNGTFSGQTSAGGYDAFLRRYTLLGTLQWTRQFGTSHDEEVRGVAVAGSAAYIVGSTWGVFPGQPSNLLDAFLAKYSSGGVADWVRQLGTPMGDYGLGVASDGASVYVAGRTEAAFPGQTNDGNYDALVARYDFAGNRQWVRQFGTGGQDTAAGIAVVPQGVTVVGSVAGSLPGHEFQGALDAYVARVGETPSPPAWLDTAPWDGRVTLTWGAPARDGNATVTGYRVYRGSSAANLELLAVVGPEPLRYVDAEVANGASYAYAVAAVNAIGEGLPSPVASGTPRAPPSLRITAPTSALTNRAGVTVSGATEPDVAVSVDGTAVPVAEDGTFSRTVTLPDGAHTFLVDATDPLGQRTSASVSVTVDTLVPALSLTAPEDGATVQTASVTVSGTTEAGADVFVNGLHALVSPSGAFSLEISLIPGANTITATATDAAGNVASSSTTVTFAESAQPTPALLNTVDLVLVLAVVALAVLGVIQVLQIRALRARLGGPPPRDEGKPPQP